MKICCTLLTGWLSLAYSSLIFVPKLMERGSSWLTSFALFLGGSVNNVAGAPLYKDDSY